MRAKIKTARRKASKLHGANAGYVSLVDRGANETPFKMVKSAEGTGAMGIKKRTNLGKSHKKLTTGKKAEDAPATKTVMAKMVFDQDHFETADEVQDWIKKAEWDATGVTVTDDGNGFFVARPEGTTDDSFTRMSKVDAETEGVEAFVGHMLVKADDDDDDDSDDDDDADEDEDEDEGEGEDDEEVEKGYKKKPMSAEDTKAKEPKAENKPAPAKLSKRAEFLAKARSSVAKFCGWDAFYSKKSTLSEALKAGMSWDATPPGFYDVQAAFNGVVQSILGDEDEVLNKSEALMKAATDYADILVGMDTFFDGYINAGDEKVSKTFSTEDARDKLAKWAENYVQFIAGETSTPASVQKTTVKKSEAAVAIDHKQVADLIAKAMEPIATKIGEVSGVVTKLADRRPSKKAADIGDNTPQKVAKASVTDGDWLRDKQKKSLLGG